MHTWLSANKLSLNVKKSNFVIFHAPPKKIKHIVNLSLNGKVLSQDNNIKYLGIFIDSNLCWKPQIEHISKKIKRSIGIISKLRYYVDSKILTSLYYAMIYPFLIYGIIVWGNSYPTTLQPIFILQKKIVRIITFSNFDEHSSPLFRQLQIIKLADLVIYNVAVFMFKFHNKLLPSIFDSLFTQVNKVHRYHTRNAAKESYYLPHVRTNYGLFNIRFRGPKVWNSIDNQIKKKIRYE